MSKKKLKIGYDILSVKPLFNFIRVIYACKEESTSWNLSLPFRIGRKGTIKESSYGRVLNDIRNSYGIDLTADVELEQDAVTREKQQIKEEIKSFKENLKKNPKDSKSKLLLSRYSNRLSRITESNATYNKYCLRKKKFDTSKLEKMVASFLLVTGQVVYDKDNEKFVFGLSKNSNFYEVNDFKSFNLNEKFNQRVFDRTYYIKAEHSNFIKKAKWTLTEFFKETDSALEKSTLKFNGLYKNLILAKVNKMCSLVKKSDARNILKSLYEFRVELINSKLMEEKENEVKSFKAFSSALEETKPPINKSIKKGLVGSFSKCFTKSKVNKKEAFNFLNNLIGLLDSRYVKQDCIEKNYIKKSELEKNYIKKSELEKNYVRIEEFNKVKEENKIIRKQLIELQNMLKKAVKSND